MTTLRNSRDANRPITGLRDLREYFERSERPASAGAVGCEFEWLLAGRSSAPASYSRKPGPRSLIEDVVRHHGFDPVRSGSNLIGAQKSGIVLSLEPGGQIELSTRPHRNLHELNRELIEVRSLIRGCADELGLRLLDLGVHPTLKRLSSLAWVPKPRYAALAPHLARTGRLGHWMMKGTASVQANFDYSSEQEFSEIVRAAALLVPLTVALFAHSPIWRGRPTGYRSWRTRIWSDTDPVRCGLPPFMLDDEVSYGDYIRYALHVPAIFCHVCPAGTHRSTFLEWMSSGFPHPPTLADWGLHLTGLYPYVRAKPQIEFRAIDALPPDVAMSAPAFLKGVLYSREARSHFLKLKRPLQLFAAPPCIDRIAREGPQFKLGRHRLLDLAKETLRMARRGLRAPGLNETVYLDPLEELVVRRKCPADLALERWRQLRNPGLFIESIAQ